MRRPFKFKLRLHTQIFIGLILGIAAGLIFKAQVGYIKFIGDIFMLLLKMMIAPMVFLSIVGGIASLGDLRKLGRIGAKTLFIYAATMSLAVINGLILVNLIQPGVGADITSASIPKPLEAAPMSFGQFFDTQLKGILKNPFGALSNGDVLAIIAFAMMFGSALVAMGEKGQSLIKTLEVASDATMWLVEKIILLAPYGVFALMANTIAESGLEVLISLGKYMATVLLGLAIHVCFVMTPLILIFGRINPIAFWRGMSEAIGVALSTSSSAATLPVSMRCVEHNLGVSSRITSFVLPLGVTVNMNGTALYEAVAAMFIAQAYGIQLGLPQQILIFITAIAAAVGAPGIPSAGLVTMAMVLTAVGLPIEGIGLILAVDRFLDMCRTAVNVADDAVGAVIVARTEGELHK